jgi:hypothetical protein
MKLLSNLHASIVLGTNLGAELPLRLFLGRSGVKIRVGRLISHFEATVRRAVYYLAIGLIFVWTGYCLADLVYVALNYWSLVPGLGLLTVFTDPEVVPGFWSSYLMRLASSWGSIVTGAGVIALLMRPAASDVEPTVEPIRKTFPVIPESERTEPRLLFIEEPRPPRYPAAPEREPAPLRREPDQLRRVEPERDSLTARRTLRQPPSLQQPRQEEGSESQRSSSARTASIFRAIRTRSPAASQPRRDEEEEEQAEEARKRKTSRDEFGFFKVEYQDGTTTIERVLRSDYDGDDAVGIALVRRRLGERAVAEGWPTKPISAITPVSHLRFTNQ